MQTAPPSAPPRVLIVDDDPLSQCWLRGVLEEAGAAVTVVGTIAAARQALADTPYAIVLCDRRLPDGDGSVLPASTAQRPRWHAMSAELDPHARAALARAGFEATWEKPIASDALLQALGLCRPVLQQRAGCTEGPADGAAAAALPDFDDAAGLRSCGDAAVLAGLRELLRVELATQAVQIEADWQAGRRTSVAEAAHRLLAGARLCGAMRLAAAAAALETRARQPARAADDRAALSAFSAACRALTVAR